MSAEVVIGGVAASISLLDELVKLLQTARESGGDITASEIVKKLPAEAFSVAKQISKELENLQSQLLSAGVDLSLPLEKLEGQYDWWKFRKGRAARQALPRIEGLKASLLLLTDDFVAVARCMGAEELLATSYTKARGDKANIRKTGDPSRPVGPILKELIEISDNLSAVLGDLGTAAPL